MALPWTSDFNGGWPDANWSAYLCSPVGQATTKAEGAYSIDIGYSAYGDVIYRGTDPATDDRWRYLRAYVYIAAFGAGSFSTIMFGSAGYACSIRVTSAGVTQLWNEAGTAAQVGSDGPTISAGAWHVMELAVRISSTGADGVAARVNLTDVAYDNAVTIGSTVSEANSPTVGPARGSGGLPTAIYVDYVTLTEGTSPGSTFNANYWPGDTLGLLWTPDPDSTFVLNTTASAGMRLR